MECNFDGGDCCLGTLTERRKKGGCIDCICYWKKSCRIKKWGDGFCDADNNIYQCLYDGGDCCSKTVNTRYCRMS